MVEYSATIKMICRPLPVGIKTACDIVNKNVIALCMNPFYFNYTHKKVSEGIGSTTAVR